MDSNEMKKHLPLKLVIVQNPELSTLIVPLPTAALGSRMRLFLNAQYHGVLWSLSLAPSLRVLT
jgi:hypothetical protein